MPFFENARQFEIHGGSFIDLKGNQNNYNYDQSMNITGNNNTANYSRNQNNYHYKDYTNINGNINSGNFTNGNFYNGPDNSITNRCSGQMTVIGQGANARVAIDPTMMASILNHSPPPPQANHRQGYAQPPANFPPSTSPQAQPYNYGSYPPPNTNGSLQPPPNGMFNNNSTGHLNQQFYPSPAQHQQPQHVPNSFPHPSPPMGHQPYAPAHHSQTSIHSAPGSVQQVQIAQSTLQPHAAHTNGLLSPPMMPQQPTLPQPELQTRPPLSGATPAQSSQSTATTGTALSGVTLVPSPTHAAAAPSVSSPTTTATQSPTPSTSTTASPVTPAQSASSSGGSHNLSEFADIPLKAGVTPSIHEGPVMVNVDKKKKKKRKFFSRIFGGKAPNKEV